MNQTALPPDWTTERKLRSAMAILQGTCDAALRLARLRAAIIEALDYSTECQRQ